MTVGDQVRVFAAMMLCGACVGGMNDLLAVFRRGAICRAAADLVLGIGCAAGMILSGLLLGCDVFRLYAFAGVAAGWAIYALSLGTIVRVSMKEFIKLSKKVKK